MDAVLVELQGRRRGYLPFTVSEGPALIHGYAVPAIAFAIAHYLVWLVIRNN